MPLSGQNPEDDRFTHLTELLAQVFADALAEPIMVRLGHPLRSDLANNVKAQLGIDTDSPGMVWVHGIQPFEPTSATMVLNGGVGKLRDDELIYGTFVYIKQVAGRWMLMGLADYAAEEYLHGVRVRTQRSIRRSMIDEGLLRPAEPPNMTLAVSGNLWSLDGTVYYTSPKYTADLTSYVPATPGKALALRVDVDPTTNTLHYTAGDEFDYDSSLGLPTHSEAFVVYYPATLVTGRFISGWARLVNGMTKVDWPSIYAGQELFIRESINFDVDKILTAEGQVLVDVDGNVLTEF